MVKEYFPVSHPDVCAMKRNTRNLLASIVFAIVMTFTWQFDRILALEAGFLSIFASLVIAQIHHWVNDKSSAHRYGFRIGVILIIGVFIYWQLIAVTAYVIAAESSMVASARLREIVVALHNWHQEHDAFPPVASYAADGKPLLSWRVHLLPYLGHQELYKQFRLNEPWDSPHNVSLLPKLPECYRLPQYGRQAPWGGTFYQLIVGPGAVFEIGKQATLPQIDARGRTSSTIILGIALEAVPWTKPADLVFEDKQTLALGKVMRHAPTPIAGLLLWRDYEPGSCRIAFADGSTRGASGKHLNELGPYIRWQGEAPSNLDIID